MSDGNRDDSDATDAQSDDIDSTTDAQSDDIDSTTDAQSDDIDSTTDAEGNDIDSTTDVDVEPDSTPLLLDVMLGTLATYLRMCGYDAAYALDRDVEADDEIRQMTVDEDRLLLTRDRELAARTDEAVLVTERDPIQQLEELEEKGFRIELAESPNRCGRCNSQLEEQPADAERPDYAPDEGPVWRCPDCGQYFWKGSHWASVKKRLEELR